MLHAACCLLLAACCLQGCDQWSSQQLSAALKGVTSQQQRSRALHSGCKIILRPRSANVEHLQ